jgi:transforming growth factor-beta-induced protein
MFRRVSWTVCAAVAATVSLALAADDARAQSKSIVETAVEAGSFKTLAAALEAADLVEALQGEGPFTVFAPTDAAFAALPEGTVATLLKPENRDRLVAILTYHVVSGNVPAKKVVELTAAKTLNGQRVKIAVDGDTVTVAGAKVVTADIFCSNGVIHVIDRVILPSEDNLAVTARKAGSFQTLLAAAQAAGLVDALSATGPLTLFAPTDEAFAKLPEGTVATLLKPENRDQLDSILKYHAIAGRVYSDDAVAARTAKTLQGDSIRISVQGDRAKINDAVLLKTDIDASNGVIHVIDSVLLPPKKLDGAAARQMIERAVARGSHLYNTGHHAACASLYAETAERMMQSGGDQMPPLVMTNLRKAMENAKHVSCPTERAWTLRRGLDRAYYAMH